MDSWSYPSSSSLSLSLSSSSSSSSHLDSHSQLALEHEESRGRRPRSTSSAASLAWHGVGSPIDSSWTEKGKEHEEEEEEMQFEFDLDSDEDEIVTPHLSPSSCATTRSPSHSDANANGITSRPSGNDLSADYQSHCPFEFQRTGGFNRSDLSLTQLLLSEARLEFSRHGEDGLNEWVRTRFTTLVDEVSSVSRASQFAAGNGDQERELCTDLLVAFHVDFQIATDYLLPEIRRLRIALYWLARGDDAQPLSDEW